MKYRITLCEKYDPAMRIRTQREADTYFEECVQHNLAHSTNTREQAETIERHNIGYWAGYYSREIRMRVEELFRCEHPILGKANRYKWTDEEILGIGFTIGEMIGTGLALGQSDSPEREKDARG